MWKKAKSDPTIRKNKRTKSIITIPYDKENSVETINDLERKETSHL